MAQLKVITDIPKDAVILNEREAMNMQWKMVQEWKPHYEMYPLKYGPLVTGISASLAGIYLNNHYRRKFKLFSFGMLSSYLPIAVLPALTSSLFHVTLITNDILLHKSQCSLCVDLKAAALQCFFGSIYPTVLAPLATTALAAHYMTYYIPPFTEPKKIYELVKKTSRKIKGNLVSNFLLQGTIAMIVTFCQQQAAFKLNEHLIKMEREYETQHSEVFDE